MDMNGLKSVYMVNLYNTLRTICHMKWIPQSFHVWDTYHMRSCIGFLQPYRPSNALALIKDR